MHMHHFFYIQGNIKGNGELKRGYWVLGQNTLGVMGELKGTLKNGDCQGNHLVIYIKFLHELRGTGGHAKILWMGSIGNGWVQ